MIKNNFNLLTDRSGTWALKCDHKRYGKPEDAIPMWVADMDFKVPGEISAALSKAAEHGIFGYTEPAAEGEYDELLVNWYKTHFDWDVKAEWNIKTPGIIFAIVAAIRALTKERESVIICQPVYYPFEAVVRANNRNIVINELRLNNGRYEMDFEDFENRIIAEKVKLFIFCSPHNPVGRVWKEEELKKICAICFKHGVYIVSDEIHSDLVLAGYKHIPTIKMAGEQENLIITCTSPAKTFNIPGLQVSNIFIKEPALRKVFAAECLKTGYSQLNAMGLFATAAAYKHGAPWLEELLGYLKANAEYLRSYLEELGCGIELVNPEGTYLMWLDCRGLNLPNAELEKFFLEKAKLWLNTGWSFGQGGNGFMRMNIACPHATLERALKNLRMAVNK